MMLKQSSSRNLRAKSFKAAMEKRPAQVSENGENEHQILKIGRKDLKPRLVEVAAEFEKHGDEEVEIEDVEGNLRENEGEENTDREEEMDSRDKEKSDEAEHDQLQDFIDEDDKDE